MLEQNSKFGKYFNLPKDILVFFYLIGQKIKTGGAVKSVDTTVSYSETNSKLLYCQHVQFIAK